MDIPTDLRDAACDECGRVYNPWLGDRFWADVDVAGEQRELICDDCRRDLEGVDASAVAPFAKGRA